MVGGLGQHLRYFEACSLLDDLRRDSDTMLDERNSPQLYDIVHAPITLTYFGSVISSYNLMKLSLPSLPV